MKIYLPKIKEQFTSIGSFKMLKLEQNIGTFLKEWIIYPFH